ncbi:MAG TPA: tetratricopeptide repeat protein [Gemmatimonadaceae bacterium]|nr:tetratricopeptide repeat protein [Gemmatimonadaceae bacterium]
MTTRWYTRLAPLVAVCATGCFATRNDVRTVQTNVLGTQAQLAQLISAQQAEIERARARAAETDSLRRDENARVLAIIKMVSDSMSVLTETANRDRARTVEALEAVQKQVLVLQQLSGASAKQMRDALAAIEANRSQMAPASPPPAGGTSSATTTRDSSKAPPTTSAAPATPQAPGPAQLYQMGHSAIQRGSYSTGRGALEELLTSYGTAPQAPAALLLVGESYARESNEAAADSVYQLVATRYPQSPSAPTALYKRANALRTAQPAKARVLLQQIMDKYATSDEAPLASALIKTLPPK